MAALSPDDVWVVGRTEGNREEPLVEHWDGLAWGVVPIPAIGGPANIGRGLVAISALCPVDVWALGYYQPGVGGESISRDVFEHWDGQRWSIVASPPPISGSGTTAMQDLAAAEPARAWAVGGMISGFGEAGAPSGALVEHWDGTTWAQAPAPTGAAPLLQVAAVGNEVWAVRGGGSFRSVGSYGSTIEGSQVLQFDGVSWTTTLSQPNVAIADITAVSAADVWVVGTQGRAPFLARWNGKAWVEPPLAGAGSTEGPPGTPYLDAVTHAGSAVVAVGSQYAYGFPPETRLWILCGG